MKKSLKIGLQTWGSQGDVRPMIALAKILLDAGHQPTLLVTSVFDKDYTDSCRELNIPLKMVASPVVDDAKTANDILDSIVSSKSHVTQIQILKDHLFESALDDMLVEAEALCNDNDIVIGHFWSYPTRLMADKTNTPYISLTLAHIIMPSRHMPFSNSWANRVLWWFVRLGLNRVFLSDINAIAQTHGLGKYSDVALDVWQSKHLRLLAVSPELCEKPQDWDDATYICGALNLAEIHLDKSASGPDDDGLIRDAQSRRIERFLEAGEKPIYITFGSLLPADAKRQKAMIDLFLQAVSAVGIRAIIQAPLWQSLGYESNAQWCFVGPTANRLIFPKCALVVHHGGAGTSHTALASGVPSLVIAHLGEQRFWGEVLAKKGVAIKPLAMKNCDVAGLSSAIRSSLKPVLLKNAQAVAAQMRPIDTALLVSKIVAQASINTSR